jgi:hypothetical protein
MLWWGSSRGEAGFNQESESCGCFLLLHGNAHEPGASVPQATQHHGVNSDNSKTHQIVCWSRAQVMLFDSLSDAESSCFRQRSMTE